MRNKETVDLWDWFYHDGRVYGTGYDGERVMSDPVVNRSDITNQADTLDTRYILRGDKLNRVSRWFRVRLL